MYTYIHIYICTYIYIYVYAPGSLVGRSGFPDCHIYTYILYIHIYMLCAVFNLCSARLLVCAMGRL